MESLAHDREVLERRTAEEQLQLMETMLKAEDEKQLEKMASIALACGVLEHRTAEEQCNLMEMMLTTKDEEQLEALRFAATNLKMLEKCSPDKQLQLMEQMRIVVSMLQKENKEHSNNPLELPELVSKTDDKEELEAIRVVMLNPIALSYFQQKIQAEKKAVPLQNKPQAIAADFDPETLLALLETNNIDRFHGSTEIPISSEGGSLAGVSQSHGEKVLK